MIAWAVYDVPLDKYNASAATPSLAIEAADGTSLGRRGPFKVADVAKIRDAAKAKGCKVSGDGFDLCGVTFKLVA